MMPAQQLINDAYIIDRLRAIAADLEAGRSKLIEYTGGEWCNSGAFSSHSLNIKWNLYDPPSIKAEAEKSEVKLDAT